LLLLGVTVKRELLAVTDEDGGIMLLNTSMTGTQSIVQGKQTDSIFCFIIMSFP